MAKLTEEEKAERKQRRKLEQQAEVDKQVKYRLQLTDRIKELYEQRGEEPNYRMIMSQVKNMREEYGYNYGSILYTLNYMINKGVNIFKENVNGSIMNLVPFYYDEAKRYCEELQKFKHQIQDFKFTQNEKTVRASKHTFHRKFNLTFND